MRDRNSRAAAVPQTDVRGKPRLQRRNPPPRRAVPLPEPEGRDRAATASTPEYGFLDGLAGFWIRRAQLKVFKSFERHLGEMGLRPADVAALFILANSSGLTQMGLAEALSTDPSTVVGLVTRLQQRKLVTRRRLRIDRRFQIVTLTPTGRALLSELEERLIKHNNSVLKALNEEERQTLVQLLRTVVSE